MRLLNMKTLMATVAAMTVGNATAQVFVPVIIPTPKKTSYVNMATSSRTEGEDSYKKMVAWKERKITWNDFKGTKAGKKEDLILSMSFVNNPELRKKAVGRTIYIYYENRSMLNALETWVEDSCRNSATLKLAQADFNLWELYARKALIEYNSTPDASLEDIYSFYKKLFNRRYKDMREATANGTDIERLDEYSATVDKELEDTSFDPEAQVAGLKEKSGYYLCIGPAVHIPFTDYISTGVGFNLSVGGFVKRHMIGLDLDLEFGSKCHKDIWTSKGTIYKGDRIFGGGITLQYGYNALRKQAIDITPYFGFGVHFYDGGEMLPEFQTGKKKQEIEKAGVSLGIGCAFDIPMTRSISIKTVDSNIRKDMRSIGIKPYFSFTHYNGDMGWVPALNVTIDWDWMSWKMR